MTIKILKRIVQTGSRISGNGSFPELKKNMIGEKVEITRPCVTWAGCLGHFVEDKTKKTYAFYLEELE